LYPNEIGKGATLKVETDDIGVAFAVAGLAITGVIVDREAANSAKILMDANV